MHRFDADGPALTGAILGGLGTFTTPDQPVSRNWARIGLDLDQKITPNAVATLSVHATAGHAEDASVSGSLGVRLGF